MFVADAATPRPWNMLPIHSLGVGRGGEERRREYNIYIHMYMALKKTSVSLVNHVKANFFCEK